MTAASVDTPATSHRGKSPAHRGLRPEIQALRALAVAAVVVYHLWPAQLTGGYVGVDVFFAISGFLITDHLRREIERTRSIRLGRFWAKRVLRLLPASFVVLAASAAATFAFVPQTYWQQFARELSASTLYVQNWALAADSVDYLAADNIASPVQHFWTLSVEEQFYVAWPLILLGTVLLAGRFRIASLTAPLKLSIALVIVGSLFYSSWLVTHDSGLAYFSTPARAWEFAAGALLALYGHRVPVDGVRRTLTSWAGIALIVVSAILYSDSTPFPGPTALLPVAGALMVIHAGLPGTRWSPEPLYRNRAVQWLGDVSYGVYLWHWPLIVIASFALGEELTALPKLGILLATLALATLTKIFVEERFRFLPTASGKHLFRIFAITLFSMIVVVGASQITVRHSIPEIDFLADARPPGLSEDICFGAEARDPDNDCTEQQGGELFPDPVTAEADRSSAYEPGCRAGVVDSDLSVCSFGADNPRVRVALAGDSHAAQWLPALQELGTNYDWQIDLYFKAACPFNHSSMELGGSRQNDSCAAWTEETIRTIESENYDAVFTSSASDYADWTDEATQSRVIEGLRETWETLSAGETPVVAIVDTPQIPRSALDCLLGPEAERQHCGQDRSLAFDFPQVIAPAAADLESVHLLDFSDSFCEENRCHSAVSGVTVWRDASSHMTATYARTLTPQLQARMTDIPELADLLQR